MASSPSWADAVEEEDKKKESEAELQKVEESLKNLEPNAKTVEPKDEDEPSATVLDHEQPPDDDDSVVIDQNDPNSPLYSAKSFEEIGLAAELLKGLYAMQYNKPSKIQETALPIVLGSKERNTRPSHLIAQAQSGTGKTATFTLGMLSRVDWSLKAPQAICVAPTRELARQIQSVVDKIGQFTPVKTALVVPDAVLPQPLEAQILIGTPGRILELSKRGIKMKDIRLFVLDEAEMMLDMQGLKDQTMRLVKATNASTCQYLLFSATYKDAVRAFAEKVVPRPHQNIKLSVKELTLDKIKQCFIDCHSSEHRFAVLEMLYENLSVGQSIVFVHKRETAKQLAESMKQAGHTISLIHGADMESAQRDRVIDDFRQGKSKVLIATNVLARGIDILQVSLVINYDLPMNGRNVVDPETYLHRIGRTGRWSRKGIAVNMVYDSVTRKDLKRIADHYGTTITELKESDLVNIDKMIKAL